MTKKEKKTLDDMWRVVIRERDQVCQKCSKPGFILKNGRPFGGMDVAHYKGRKNLHIRWNKDNTALMCKYHHYRWAHSEPREFNEWWEKRIGPRKMELLLLAARQTHKLYFDDIYIRLKLEQQKYID